MSMFDYDARPVTPGVVLVGTPTSRGGYAIRDFLSRNGYPFEWVDARQPDAVRGVLGGAEGEPSALPLGGPRGGGGGPGGAARPRPRGRGGPPHGGPRGGGPWRSGRNHVDDRKLSRFP